MCFKFHDLILLLGEMSQRTFEEKRLDDSEMERGQVIKQEGRRGEKLQWNHLGQHRKREIETVDPSNCRIVLVFLRLFSYMTCAFVFVHPSHS